MTITIFILLLLFLLAGIAGTFLVVLPGIPFMFITVLAYAIFDRFHRITGWNILFFAALTLASLFIDYLSGIMGAKLFGASKYGTIGGIIGGLIGLFVFPPFGIFIGMFLGVIIFEVMLSKKSVTKSVKSGTGSILGSIAGIVINLIIALAFLVSFIVLYWK
jgi:hypothetical protein